MGDLRAATAALIEDHPELAEPLAALLEIDAATDAWTFEEIPLDSGQFGEVVASGIVEQVDDGYRIVDPTAVERTLAGETTDPTTTRASLPSIPRISRERLRNALPEVAAVGAALAVLFLTRIVTLPSVLRESHVISPGNDPYYFRHHTDRLLAESTDWTALPTIATSDVLPTARRPLAHATNWWVAALLGGDQAAADLVAAWLPVVASIGLGIAIYLTARTLTGDVRVGIASVLVLALVPVHAVYTGIGFLDHNVHQYFWFGLTILTLTALATRFQRNQVRAYLRAPGTWAAALLLAPALTFSMYAWGGSIMMCVPLAAYIGVRTLMDTRDDVSPTLANLPLLVGLVLATALSAHLHLRWDWHEPFVLYVPLLVTVGTIAVMLGGELFRRTDWPLPILGAAHVVIAAGGIVFFRTQFPDQWSRLMERSDDLVAREGATETMSLFDNLFTPIMQIGLDVVLALAVLGWAWYHVWRRYEPAWLVLTTYATVWLGFAWYQIRFAGQAAIVLSTFGGMGLVWLLSWIDLARVPRPFAKSEEATSLDPPVQLPDRLDALGLMALILLLFCGLSLFMVPNLAGDVTYDDDQYASVVATEEAHTSAQAHDQPGFVLSDWGDNRMYNYVLTGEAASYSYARSQYEPFITAADPEDRYDAIGDRVGYVVIDDVTETPGENMLQARLHTDLTPTDDALPSLAHYRMLHLGESATAYMLVPGATIVLNESTDANVTAHADVTVDGDTYAYERPVTPLDNTSISTTVAYPGTYTIGNHTITVDAQDVIEGTERHINRTT